MSAFCKHGTDAYSYETCIMTFDHTRKVWIYNATQYSKTTSKHQTATFGRPVAEIRKESPRNGNAYILCNVPRGASPSDLCATLEHTSGENEHA